MSRLNAGGISFQDSISLCKRAEQERLEALEELDAAVKRRDHVQLREAESRTRINAAKSAEIDRLREELRNKDESLQVMLNRIYGNCKCAKLKIGNFVSCRLFDVRRVARGSIEVFATCEVSKTSRTWLWLCDFFWMNATLQFSGLFYTAKRRFNCTVKI